MLKYLFCVITVSFKDVEASHSDKAYDGNDDDDDDDDDDDYDDDVENGCEQSTAPKPDIPDSMFIFKSKNP